MRPFKELIMHVIVTSTLGGQHRNVAAGAGTGSLISYDLSAF